jgi:hypothetical protein
VQQKGSDDSSDEIDDFAHVQMEVQDQHDGRPFQSLQD